MKGAGSIQREAGPWVVAGAIAVAVVVLMLTGWTVMRGQAGDVGPSKKVYPGMYDLRAEIAKGRAARETNGAQPGQNRNETSP